MALAESANVIINLLLKDNASSGIGRVNRSLSGLQGGAFQLGKGIGQVGAGLERVFVRGGAAVATGIGFAIKAAGDFESQLNTINTIALVKNPEQLTAIGEGIRKTFRDTGQPLEDLTAAYYDLLSAGVKVGDAQGELNTAVRLGIGGLGSTAEAVDLLTTAQNSYGLSQEGVAHAADIFAKAVEDGKVKISDLAATFADVAPVAKTSGVSLEELGASYAFLTAKGVPAADASTQLNRAMIELLKPSPKLIAVQKKLGESFESLIKKKGLVGTFQAIREEADKLGIPFQDLFGRLEGYKFALATTGDSFADFSAEYAKFGDTAGTVDEQFAAKQQGFNFQLDKLKAGLKDAGITIGSALLPKLVPLLDKLNEFIGAHQGDIANFGQKLADGFSAFADKVASTDWGPLLDGLKIAADLGKKVVDLFLSLPPAVQGAVIAGAAVNKLSGGLLGSGVGNILGGGLKLIFERGASPGNPLWVQSVGGLGGGLPPVAGKLATAGLVIKSLLGVTTAIGLGALLGNAIGREVFFNPTVAPAKKFEQGTFEGALTGTDPKKMAADIASIDAGIHNLKVDILPGGLGQLLFGQEISELEKQRADLVAALAKLDTTTQSEFTKSRATSDQLKSLQQQEAARAATRHGGFLAAMNELPWAQSRALAPSFNTLTAKAAETATAIRAQAGILTLIANKKLSFTANVYTSVSAKLSVASALSTQRIYTRILSDNNEFF